MDHPRLRGEQGDTWAEWPLGVGSPPLARGTVLYCAHSCISFGITPACAGNSVDKAHALYELGDHPRLRGEQYTALPPATRILGSPPLARGTVKSGAGMDSKSGITPACAGNSFLVPVALTSL